MDKYIIYGNVKSRRDDVIGATKEFVSIISNCKKVYLRSYYERNMNDIQLQTYNRKSYCKTDAQTIQASVDADLRDEANHIYFSLTGRTENLVSKFVSENSAKAYSERVEAMSDAELLFNRLEDEAEALANEKFQQEYESKLEQEQLFIDGDNTVVESKMAQTFLPNNTEISLPFDVTLKVSYDKNSKKASVEIDIPTYLGIPTQKVNVSATYGRVSLKDKLVRELDDENSKTIIGLAFYIASFVFNLTPNIEMVETSVWNGGYTAGLLWIKFERSKFAGFRPQSADPLRALFNWIYVCDIKVVRGGTRIDALDAQSFKKQINAQRESYS